MNYKRGTDRQRFIDIVCEHYKKQGRHSLPWRAFPKSVPVSIKAYRVLVSEVMLQQTQVERVIPYYERFIRAYPNPRRLAEAPLKDVLILWQGLGYNRRARMLHEAGKNVTANYNGVMPSTYEELKALPGVGEYTASAVMAFAFNKEAVLIETNIRTAITHHFFTKRQTVPDSSIREVLELLMPETDVRGWYSALMDYGAHLKARGVRINTKSAHYTKQKPFKGSVRELRGAMLRELLVQSKTRESLVMLFGKERRGASEIALDALCAEGMVVKTGNVYALPS